MILDYSEYRYFIRPGKTDLRIEIDRLKKENAQLKEQIHLLQTLHFGTKSEKLTSEDAKQASMVNEAEDSAFEQTDEIETETREIKAHTKTVSAVPRRFVQARMYQSGSV